MASATLRSTRFLLELLGKKRGIAIQMALYVGASNFATTYMTWLDGWSYDRMRALWPATPSAARAGMLGMDALSTSVGMAILWAMVSYVRRSHERSGTASQTV
jgi:hypothetical protein